MLCLQASIGALNDAADARLDARGKPWKPIPSGAASVSGARILAAAALVLGLGMSAVGGPATVLVALAGVGCGYAYDLRLSRTRLSWLPLAVALPLLPVHAWVGATGSVPAALVPIIPAAIVAGAALALGNGLVDALADRAAGATGAAVRVSDRAAWTVQSVLLAAVAVMALLLSPSGADRPGWAELVPLARLGGFVVGVALLAIGALLLRGARPTRRVLGWQLEAAGVACVGVAWIGSIAGSSAVPGS